MSLDFVVALIIAVPIIVFPAAFLTSKIGMGKGVTQDKAA
jgi:hypothetical protein